MDGARPILLVHPTAGGRACAPPLGLLTVAACLERAGFTVRVVDLQIETLDIAGALRDDPLCVGIHTATATFPRAVEIARAVKDASKTTPIVLAGPHASFLDREILQSHPEIDFVVRFEGETAMCALARALAEGGDPARAPSLTFRDGGLVRRTPLAAPQEPLDDLPPPARHLVGIERYPNPTGNAVITSRGCPYRCVFCASTFFHWPRCRARSTALVVEEIEDLVRAGRACVTFFDDLFAFDRERTVDLCDRLIAAGTPALWGCETRVDSVDAPLLAKMHAAGCRYLFFGTESADAATLRGIGKQQRPDRIGDVVRAAREAGIQVKTSLMIGLPDDTEDSVMRSLDFFEEVRPDFLAPLIATPFPGTPLWNEPEKFGVKVIDKDLSHYDYMHPIFETRSLGAADIRSLYLEVLAFNAGAAALTAFP